VVSELSSSKIHRGAATRMKTLSSAEHNEWMTCLAQYLNNITFFLILCCLITVSFSFSLETYHPFEAIKELLFHLFVLLIGSFVVVRTLLTSTIPLKKDPLYVLVFLYFCYNAFSFALSPYVDKGYFINLTLLILFFFAVAASVRSEKQISYVLYAIAFIVGISSIYSLFQFFGDDFLPVVNVFGSRGLGIRVSSFFGNPNEFAAVLVMSIPLLLSGFMTKQRTARYVFASCILLAIVGILLTSTRTALLGASVSIALFVVISFGQASRKRYLWAVCATVVLAVAGFFLSLEVLEPLKVRKHWLQNTLGIIQDHPLLGTGVGSFNVYYPAYRSRSTDIALGFESPLPDDERVLEHTHNEFLEIFSDLGLLGVLLFLGILCAFTYNYYVQWNPKKKYLIAGNCCALVGVLIYNLYSQNLRFVFVAMFFWLILALQSAILSGSKTEERATLNTGKIIASFLLLSFSIMIFWSHSWKVYLADHYLQKGVASYNVQDYQMVEAHLREAVENYPQHKWALYYLGISQFRLQKLVEAEETLRKVIRLDPNYLSSHYWMANILFMTQDFEKAKAEYHEALRVDDAFGVPYYDLGIIAVREGDIQQAGDYFKQALPFFERAHAWGDESAVNYIEELREDLRAIGF